ncbi:MAG: preprotein translocase subunit SecG [Bacteroidetes bacterium]|nr:preprotein translocase subunit SecG [Bacteroidota bacterium]
MFWFLITVEIIVSILLIVAVLMQSSKGGGLAGTFGGGQVGMMFGVRRTTDFLTRATQVLAIIFGALALIINIAFLPRGGGSGESVIQGQGGSTQQQQSNAPPLPPPQSPTQPPAGGK